MTKFFCSDFSRQAGEDIIGTGTNYSTYVLIECPTPWEFEAFDSKCVPQDLRDLVAEVKKVKLSVRFLLIAPNKSKSTSSTKILIYEKQKSWISNGYRKREFDVENIEQVAPVVRQYLRGEPPDCDSEENQTRDILVCTHGSHDICCARYGNRFYFQAVATIYELGLSNVRIWRVSHIGGHRFAPTMIDFPDGRYYGALDQESFRSILTRTGDITCFNRVYRGWGILPIQIQVLEREFILRYGWDWFNYKVAHRIIHENSDKSLIQAELTFEKPDGSIHRYQAELVKDETKTMQLKGSCTTAKESEFVKYSVENLHLCSEKIAYFEAHEFVRNVQKVKGFTNVGKSESLVESQGTNPTH